MTASLELHPGKLHTDTPFCQASICDMDMHFGQDESVQLRMFVAK